MSSPQTAEPCEVGLVRYRKRERQWRQVFLGEEVTTCSDPDWAGCKDIRKSSSAGVILLGSHMLKASTSTQHVIVRSSAESELYAALLGASVSRGISVVVV